MSCTLLAYINLVLLLQVLSCLGSGSTRLATVSRLVSTRDSRRARPLLQLAEDGQDSHQDEQHR